MASKNKGGRPSLYETKIKPHLKTIAILREQGVSHDDIVKLMGISKTTYYKYMILIDEFVNAIKNGDKELVNNAKMSLGKLVRLRPNNHNLQIQVYRRRGSPLRQECKSRTSRS